MNGRTDRSIPELFSDVLAQLAKLIGNEFDLARAEVSGKASQVARAAALIGAGAVILIPALVLLLFSAAAAMMHAGFSDPVAYLITGGAAVLLAAILIGVGISRMTGDALKPSVTLDQLRRDKVAAKEMMK
ncbi:MAG: phage holin family protein [Bradyrhizobium sp.]|nr:phage holin family protein [Bradyrhizobium sp.]